MKKALSILLALALCVSLLVGCTGGSAPAVTSMDGVVTAINDESITLQGTSVTVTFALSSSTEYVGGTTIVVGDNATIEYTGDVTANPVAAKITFSQSAPDESNTIEGVIVDASMSNLVVTVADGNSYNFTIDDTTVINAREGEGILLGDDVSIVYVGDLESWPAASSVTIIDSAIIPHDSRDVQGTVSEVTDTTLTVNIDSGHTYTFDYSANIVLKGCTELKSGDKIKITFTGSLTGTPIAVVVTMIEAAADVPTGQKIVGTCVAIDGRNVTISVDSSHSYTFVTTTATAWTGDNLALNSRLTIIYTGYLGKNPVATSVYTVNQVSTPSTPASPPATTQPAPTPDPAPIPNPIPQSVEKTLSGVVTELKADNFTIEDESGTTHTFNVNGDTDYEGTLEEGARVNVDYMTVSNIAITITVVPRAAMVGVTGPMIG